MGSGEQEHSSELLAKERAEAAAKWEAQFKTCNWADKDSIVGLFPKYAQVQHELRTKNKRNVSKAVDIESFTLKTPFGDQTLLQHTPLKLEPNSRQCLYGPNSSGKTLLFTNISEGKIKDFPTHLHVHHCKELETHELHDTVLGTVVNSHPLRNVLLKCEKQLQTMIDGAAESKPEDATLEAWKENLHWIKFSAESIQAYTAEDRASKMLRVLGFDDIGQAKPVTALSGGLRMRVALAMAFFIEADLLLLDEPTNHLDFPSVLWLENRLRGYRGSFVLVSHDRELLNNVCTQVLLIEDKQIKYYSMGFKNFEVTKAKEDKKKSEEIEKYIEKNRNADPSTMAGRLLQEKKDWSERYYARQIALAGKFTFPVAVPLANTEKDAAGNPVAADDIKLIQVKDLTFSYAPEAPTPVFIFRDPINFTCTATTRIGVMGPNGAGKSTFLKLVTQKLKPTTGDIIQHPNYTLAYFGQHSTAELNLDMTPIEFMCAQFPDEKAGVLRGHLAKTGVVGGVADTRMQRLSFSQRSCVIFAKLTLICPHLLILDEPTNFLDLESVDSLIGACNKYKGALMLVSHNRDFLKRCAKQYLSIVPGQFNLYDDLKTAERSTYSFIAEMEEGGNVGKSALASCAGGASVHASQLVGGGNGAAAAAKPAATKDASGAFVISSSSTPAPAKPAAAAAGAAGAKAAPATYAVGEKVVALWTDGKWYPAIVKKIDGPKHTITYTQYGNTTTVNATSIKKAPAPAAGAAAAGAKAAPAKK